VSGVADGTGAGVVGFIGLGIMGKPMARNLLAAEFDLVVHSRSPGPVDEMVEAGARRASTPGEVAAASDSLITMLPDTPDVESVLFGDDGAAGSLRPGSLAIDMSTISPLATREFAARITANGVGYLDAPVSGGEKGAVDGTLSIMIGGTAEDVERARPLFEAMGKTIVHVGDSGAGQVAKACNQLVVASTIEGVAEALTLAKRAGVDPARVREALLGGFAGSKIMEMHGQRMLDDNFQPGFRAGLHRKDARIVLDTAHGLGVPVPGFEPVAQALERLVAEGGGDLDHSALITLVQRGAEDEA
jgi:2-hydroxy-3-oxopropionate reductase